MPIFSKRSAFSTIRNAPAVVSPNPLQGQILVYDETAGVFRNAAFGDQFTIVNSGSGIPLASKNGSTITIKSLVPGNLINLNSSPNDVTISGLPATVIVADIPARNALTPYTGQYAYVENTGNNQWGLFMWNGNSWILINNQFAVENEFSVVQKQLNFLSSSPMLIASLPPNSVVLKVEVQVEQFFDDSLSTISVGTLSNPNLLFENSDGDLTVEGGYVEDYNEVFVSNTNIYAFLNAGTSTQGFIRIFVSYVAGDSAASGTVITSTIVPNISARNALTPIIGQQVYVENIGNGGWGMYIYTPGGYVILAQQFDGQPNSEIVSESISWDGLSKKLIANIPAGATVTNISLNVLIPFDSSSEINIGTDAIPNILVDNSIVDLTTIGTQSIDLMFIGSNTENIPIYINFDANSSITGNAVVTIKYTVQSTIIEELNYNDPVSEILGSIPVNSSIENIHISVTEAFNGSSSLFSLGIIGNPTLFLSNGDIDLSIVDNHIISSEHITNSLIAENVLVSYIANGATQGKAIISINFKPKLN